ncbi:MAG: CHAT domain-containing protein, partial [Bacteroidota bacterium]
MALVHSTHTPPASILEEYKAEFAPLYVNASYPQGMHPHYIFACHAAYPSIVSADLLYQVWYNFRSYKLGEGELAFMPFEVVNDFLLSGCCREIGEGIFKVDKDSRKQLLKDLKLLFGQSHFLRVVKLLDQYSERNTDAYYEKRIKVQHKETIEVTLDPETALKKFIQSLEKKDLKRVDLVKMKIKLETFEQENSSFQRLKKLVLEAEKGFRGKAQTNLFRFEEEEEQEAEPCLGIFSFGMPEENISSKEFNELSRELSRLTASFQTGVFPIQVQASPSKIRDTFGEYGENIKFFHYGGIPAELIQGIDLNEDNPDKVQAERLLDYLGEKIDVRLAFLNIEYSSSLAGILLEAGVQAVIASNGPLSTAQRISFAEAFYDALIKGSTIEEAFNSARSRLNPPRKMTKAASKKAPKRREEPFPYTFSINPNTPRAGKQTLKDWQIQRPKKKIESTLSPKLNLNRHIDLSNQGLEEIPPEILAETSILSLNLSNNKLTFVPAQLLNLVELRQLNLNNNPHLDAHNFDWSRLEQLEVLQLSRTDLTSVPLSLGKAPNLRQLKLYRNEIEEFPDHILGLEKLSMLDLSYNQISRLPEGIGRMRSLERLHLEWNRISEIPESIGNLADLKVLQIHANNLSRLPQTMWELGSLQ